jgi:hypothetical protein
LVLWVVAWQDSLTETVQQLSDLASKSYEPSQWQEEQSRMWEENDCGTMIDLPSQQRAVVRTLDGIRGRCEGQW